MRQCQSGMMSACIITCRYASVCATCPDNYSGCVCMCMHVHVCISSCTCMCTCIYVRHACIQACAPAQAYLWYSRPPWAELPTLRGMLAAAVLVSVSSCARLRLRRTPDMKGIHDGLGGSTGDPTWVACSKDPTGETCLRQGGNDFAELCLLSALSTRASLMANIAKTGLEKQVSVQS